MIDAYDFRTSRRCLRCKERTIDSRNNTVAVDDFLNVVECTNRVFRKHPGRRVLVTATGNRTNVHSAIKLIAECYCVEAPSTIKNAVARLLLIRPKNDKTIILSSAEHKVIGR